MSTKNYLDVEFIYIINCIMNGQTFDSLVRHLRPTLRPLMQYLKTQRGRYLLSLESEIVKVLVRY
jgi:hypothetical protein